MKKRKYAVTLFLALLLLLGGILPAAAANGQSFSDVPPAHWASSAIQRCYDSGLVNGMGNGRFEPDGTLTYAQFSALMCRAFLADETAANAGAGSAWYSAYVRTVEQMNLLDYSDGSVTGRKLSEKQVDTGISRYEMALLIYNYAQARCNSWYEDTVGSLKE